jgi:hypothetical protein
MLFREMTYIYCEGHKDGNTLCGGKTEFFLNITSGVTHSHHCPLKDSRIIYAVRKIVAYLSNV